MVEGNGVSQKRPNFLIIVADDLGFTDLSPFGGEIDTPNLARLRKGWQREGTGAVFTNFHTAPACSPTRSMLFSGTDNHIAGLGQMAEFMRDKREIWDGRPGYEGYLNDKVAALPQILQDNGYYTWISGKWHLGLLPEYWPSKKGFEKVFTLLPGAGNHYKYFPTLHDKTGLTLLPPIYCEDDKKFDPETLPEDYYSTDYFTDKGINFLNNDELRRGRPFFGCLTYTAPHWPYQAPKEKVDKYKGIYNDGPEELRKARLRSAAKLKIIPEGIDAHKMTTLQTKRWTDLTEEERLILSRIMETYAAMVDILDENIGRFIKEVEKKGELDNTVIYFMSDNGAEGLTVEAMPLRTIRFQEFIEKYYNNDYQNIGRKDSFVTYGDQWAQAATAPFYKYKAWASEGGIRCPLILHYPEVLKNTSGKLNIFDSFTTVMDILPTILEAANIRHPGRIYKGREIAPTRGKSWLNYLIGNLATVYSDDTPVGWELFGQEALRKGSYKILQVPKPYGSGTWELYNIEEDPGETENLASHKPEKLQELVNDWSIYVAETGLVESGDLFSKLADGTTLPDLIWKLCE